LPDGRSEIFLQRGLDRKIISRLLICSSGKWDAITSTEWTRGSLFSIIALNGHQNLAIRISAALAVYEAAHNSGGGDASGNAAFAPRLPLKPCTVILSVLAQIIIVVPAKAGTHTPRR
jgi:hypothetical protein